MKVKTIHNNKVWKVASVHETPSGQWIRLVTPIGPNGQGTLSGHTMIRAEHVTEWL